MRAEQGEFSREHQPPLRASTDRLMQLSQSRPLISQKLLEHSTTKFSIPYQKGLFPQDYNYRTQNSDSNNKSMRSK